MKRKRKAFATTDEEKFYNIMIIAMIIGIIITSGFVFYFRSTLYNYPASFTELYFPNPDSLPNKIRLGQEYQFPVTIKSHENQTKTYNYTSTIELYRIYNYTESKYNCISRYRGKTYLRWANETENLSVIPFESKYPVFENMIVSPEYDQMIEWPRYNLEFGFSPPFGNGKLAIFFRNKTDVKYTIIIDQSENKTYFNGNVTYEGIDLTENNKVKLTAENNRIRMYLNNVLVVDEPYDDIYNGAFGLESKDAFFVIQRFKVYRDSPIVIPDKDTIIEYSIDANFMFNQIYKIKDLTERTVRLLREYKQWNATAIDCNKDPFYCKYFDLPNDISFYVKENNLTKVVEKIPVSSQRVNMRMYPYQKQQAQINWSDYTIDFSHNQLQLGSPGIIIAKFGDKWAIMITRNNSYFFRPENGEIKIDEIRNPEKPNITKDNVLINVTKTKITLMIDNATVFTRVTPDDYTNATLDIYIKNSFISIDSVYLKRSDERCNDPFSFEFCELTLSPFIATATAPKPKVSTNEKVSYYDSFENSIDVLSTQKHYNLSDYAFSDDFLSGARNQTQNKVSFELPVSNPFIPSKRVDYNYPGTKILNSTNFGFDYSYIALDGARVLGIGLDSLKSEYITSMYVAENGNQIIIYHIGWEKPVIIQKAINKSKPHTLLIKVKNRTIEYSIDYRKIFTTDDKEVNSGSFFIDMKNTYAEIGNIHLNDKDNGISRTLSFPRGDPCQLRTIYQKNITDSITLEPGEELNITKRLKVMSDFDYGRVSFELYGSGGMPENKSLEIHAWLIRDDS